MSKSHPYISGAVNITKMVVSLRKSFPAVVNSDTVKKFGYAPNNESYVINSLQFVGVLDSDGKKTEHAALAFSSHKDEDFSKSFELLVKKAYSDLFELYGDGAWKLDKDSLITFFRQSDDTSAIIGSRQAAVFQTFASLSGHGDVAEPKSQYTPARPNATKNPKPTRKKPSIDKNDEKLLGHISPISPAVSTDGKKQYVQMTVRLEINIPSDGSKETYDNIFRSIKENLLND